MTTIMILRPEIRNLQLDLREAENDDARREIGAALAAKINELKEHRDNNARILAKRQSDRDNRPLSILG
jgi:hypothetical protein